MSKAVLVLLATTVGLGLVSLHLVGELRAQREQAQALQARIGELEHGTRRPPPASTPQSPDSPFGVGPAPGGNAPGISISQAQMKDPAPAEANRAPLAPEDVMQQIRQEQERQRTLMQDPAYRDAMRAQMRASQARAYPDLAQELGLNVQQTAQLMELLADQQLRMMDQSTPPVWSGRDKQPSPAQIEEAQRKFEQLQQQHESELADLLGSNKFQAWKEYQSTLGVRHEVTDMRAKFAGRGVPLQESQAKPLIKALAQEQQRMMKEWSEQARVAGAPNAALGVSFVSAGAMVPLQSGDPAANPAEALEQQLEMQRRQIQRRREVMADILTPQQLEVFDEEQRANLEMQEAHMRLMRAQSRARPATQGGSR